MKTYAVLALGFAIFSAASWIGIDRNERMECDFWQHEAQQYPSYYLTHWQQEQCDRWHITINAPVK